MEKISQDDGLPEKYIILLGVIFLLAVSLVMISSYYFHTNTDINYNKAYSISIDKWKELENITCDEYNNKIKDGLVPYRKRYEC